MRRTAALFVTAVMLVGGAVAAAPAGASAPTKTSAFCKGLKNFDLPDVSGGVSEDNAAATAKQLRKLARKATGSTKKATKTMAAAFQEIADGGSAKDLLTGDYVKAAGTFSLATLKCATAGITLPDISLPGS